MVSLRDPWGEMKGDLQNQKTYYDKQGNFRPQYQKQNQQFMQGMNPPSGRGNTPALPSVQVPPNIMSNPLPQPMVQPQRQLGIKKQIVPQKTVKQTVVEKKVDSKISDNRESKLSA